MKLKGVRPWYDGSGKNKRLRVKGIVDLPPKKVEPDPNGPDPEKLKEEHAAAQKALREEDDHKVGKIFEPLLDDIHKNPSQQHEDPAETFEQRIRRRTADFEAALSGELRELARQTKNWGWAFRWDPMALVIRSHDPQKIVWEYRCDADHILALQREHGDNARAIAGALCASAYEKIKDARIRTMLGGRVPVENERMRA